MSKVEPHAPLRERQEAMRRLWPQVDVSCVLRPERVLGLTARSTGNSYQCGVQLVPLTVSPSYLSMRCPSCRVLTVHHRVAAPFQHR